MTSPALAYWRANFGGAVKVRPRRSWATRIWPSQSGPAPMPMVGICSSRVIWAASSRGTASRTTAKALAAFDFDGFGATFLDDADSVAQRFGDVGVIGAEGHVGDEQGVLRAAADGAGVV